jgi:hypothetical protein
MGTNFFRGRVIFAAAASASLTLGFVWKRLKDAVVPGAAIRSDSMRWEEWWCWWVVS